MAKHRSLRALIVGLALIAAACAGSEDAVPTEAANPVDESADAEAPASDTADPTDATTGDGTDDNEDATAADPAAGDNPTDDAADGEEQSAPVSGPPPSLPPEEARAAAEQNIPDLQTSDDVRDIEVVSVYDGSVTSLREVVTGDRPVLVWFWAPH